MNLDVFCKLWWSEKHLYRYWESNNRPPFMSLFTHFSPGLLKCPGICAYPICGPKVEVFSEPGKEYIKCLTGWTRDGGPQTTRSYLLQITGLLVLCAVNALFLARNVHSYNMCEDILNKCNERCKVLIDSDCELDEEFIPAKSPCNCCAYCLPKVRK
jgi:hypothetical protein